jgi:exodeoxyribonuclease V gamma subunit
VQDRERIIEIKQLSNLAKHPIRFHFQQALQLHMQLKEDEAKDFLLSALSRSLLRKKGLKGSIKAQVRIWSEQGKLPIGVFGEAAVDAVEEELSDLKQHLKDFAIEPEQIFSIELSLLCKEPLLHAPYRWVVPAIPILMPNGSVIHLVGLIENLTPHGMIVHGENKLQDLVKHWPLLLTIGCLKQLPFKVDPNMLLTKSGAIKEGGGIDVNRLMQQYLIYYDLALNELSPLMPEWISSFIFDSPAELEKLIAQSVNHPHFEDPYLQWLKRRGALPEPSESLTKWANLAKELFQPLDSLHN